MAVYFIRNPITRSIKIGFSIDPDRRIKDLQTASESELIIEAVLPGTLSTEQYLHQRWEHLHVRGEWYKSDPDLEDFVDAVRSLGALGRDKLPIIESLLGRDDLMPWVSAILTSELGSDTRIPSQANLRSAICWFNRPSE